MVETTELLKNSPLFLGLTQGELNDVTQDAHLALHHHKKGSAIVSEGDECQGLVIVVEGWIEIDTYADNRSYRMTELMQAQQMLEPDKLFGLTRTYRSTYTAYTTCTSLIISKEELSRCITKYLIVRINIMNIICRKAQHMEHLPWMVRSANLKERIAMFIKHHSRYPAGKKVLRIKMTQLAIELNATRLDISKALNEMAEEEKILITRNIVTVPALQLL